MQRIIISFFIVLTASTFCLGQHTQTTKNTVDQTLRSSGRVNTSTLGMEFDLPLGGYKGRGFDLPLGLSYSSKLWKFEEWEYNPSQTKTFVNGVYSEDAAAGWTSSLAQPYIEYTGMTRLFDEHGKAYNPRNGASYYQLNYVRRITVFLPGGESHELRAEDGPLGMPTPTPGYAPLPPASAWEGEFVATDGSGIKYVQSTQNSTFRLYLPDGSYYDFYSGSPEMHGHNVTQSYIRKAYKLTDVNGNYVQFTAPSETYPYGSWTDQLGRVFPVMVPAESPLREPEITEFTDEFLLPGMGENSYELQWKRLDEVFASSGYSLRHIGEQGGSEPFENPLFENENVFTTSECGESEQPQFPNNSLLTVSAFHFHDSKDGWVPFNPLVLAEIKLPNGAIYRFKYNEYAEIEKIEYPFGGYEEFDYEKVDSLAGQAKGYQQTNRGVVERRVYEDTGVTPITYTYSSASTDHNYRTSVTAPDGTQTDTFMHRGIKPLCDITMSELYTYGGLKWGYDSPLAGRVWETRVFSSGQPKQIKQRTVTRWVTAPQTPYLVIRNEGPRYLQWNARVDTSQTITYEGTSGVSAATKFEYAAAADWGSPLNVTKKSEYGYETTSDGSSYTPSQAPPTSMPSLPDPTTGVSLVKQSETTYETGSNYTDRNILRLPTETRLINPTNPNDVLAKSQFVYDESAYFDNNYTTTNWQDPQTSYRGNITTSKTWNKDTNTWIEAHTMFDNFGNVRKVWDTSGDSTRFIETEYSSTYKYAYATKTKAPAPDPTGNNGTTEGSEITRTFDFDTGLLLSVTDAHGQTATTEYDDFLRPERVNPPAGGSISEVIYNDTPGNMWVKRRQQIDEVNWAESTTYFDGLGRAVKARTKDLQGDVMAAIEFDSFGRVEKTSNPYRADANGDPTETVYWSKVRYDEANRVVETYAPAPSGQTGNSLGTVEFGISTLTNLVGTYVTATDASGRKSRAISGIYGLMRVDEATGIGGTVDQDLGTLGDPHQPTSYSFNVKGELVKVTQGKSGQPTQYRYFAYDSLGRLVRVRQPEQTPNTSLATTGNPDNNQWTAGYTYDVFGNVISMTDAKNTTITNQYDKAGRTVKRTYSDGTPQVESSFMTAKVFRRLLSFQKGR